MQMKPIQQPFSIFTGHPVTPKVFEECELLWLDVFTDWMLFMAYRQRGSKHWRL